MLPLDGARPMTGSCAHASRRSAPFAKASRRDVGWSAQAHVCWSELYQRLHDRRNRGRRRLTAERFKELP
jgi:hypothetical protein